MCIECHGRGLDVVTHGQAVQTGAAAKKSKGKARAAQHKGKKEKAAKRSRVVADSSEDEDAEVEDGR